MKDNNIDNGRNSPKEERIKFLKNKDFTNAKTVLEWLTLAKEAVEENSHFIINNEDKENNDAKKCHEENEFICKVLDDLQSSTFLMKRKEEAEELEKVKKEQEQGVIEELQVFISGSENKMKKIREIIEESNSSDKSVKRNSLLNLKADLKKSIQTSQVINGNKKVIKNVRKILALVKKAADKNLEGEVLSKHIEQILQETESNDDDLKKECEKLHKLYNRPITIDKYKIIMGKILIKVWLKSYLDEWYSEESDELTDNQKQKLEIFDELEKENKELKQKLEELESKNEESKSSKISLASIPKKNKQKENKQKEEMEVQEWLNYYYEEDKEEKQGIFGDPVNKTMKLRGDLVIRDYPNLEIINLDNTEEITSLTIENCPKIESISVYCNKITKIVGLEELPLLNKLNCVGNLIDRLDISKNFKLTELRVFRNPPNMELVGLQNLSYIEDIVTNEGNPINFSQIVRKELEEVAEKLGIDKNELENKSGEEIKGLIQEEGKIIRENETKLNDPELGLPGLLKERKIDDNELEKIRKEIAKVEELEKEQEQTQKTTRAIWSSLARKMQNKSLARFKEGLELEKRRQEKLEAFNKLEANIEANK